MSRAHWEVCMPARLVGTLVAGAVAAVVAVTGMPAASAAADTTPPVLHSLGFEASTATPGEDVVVHVDATDDVAVTSGVVSVYEESSGLYQHARFTGAASTVAFHVDSSWGDGTYHLGHVTLTDAANNYARYYSRGHYYQSRPASSTTTHDVDLPDVVFTVSGARDITPPELHSFALGSSAATTAEEPFTVEWSVSDARSTVSAVEGWWVNQSTGAYELGVRLADPAPTGSTSVQLPYAGVWVLSDVRVVDSNGASAVYRPDGRLILDGSGTEGRHDLDLKALDMTLRPATPRAAVVARPGRLTLVRTGLASDPTVLSGFRVTVQPAGITRDVTVSALSGPYDIVGLPNGVNQTVTLTARSAWGESPAATASGRPVLSGNVTGIPDVTGDGRPDVVAQRQYGIGQDASVLSYPGTGRGGLRAATTYLPAGQGGCEQLAAGDVYIVGTGDPLCQHDDLLALNRGGGGTELGSRGWRQMRWVDGGYSLNADPYADVLALNAEGELLLYPKTSRDRLLAPTRIGTGWGSMISIVSAGDLTGDRRNDIAAVDAAGRLWLYPGNGAGGVTVRRQIGSGWQNMGALLPLRDLSGDGKADLGGITMGGDLRLYRGTGTGGVRAGVVIGPGWQRYL